MKVLKVTHICHSGDCLVCLLFSRNFCKIQIVTTSYHLKYNSTGLLLSIVPNLLDSFPFSTITVFCAKVKWKIYWHFCKWHLYVCTDFLFSGAWGLYSHTMILLWRSRWLMAGLRSSFNTHLILQCNLCLFGGNEPKVAISYLYKLWSTMRN